MIKEITKTQTGQTGLGSKVYPFVPQTAALPESDAGSDVIKPASDLSSKNIRPCAQCCAQL